MLLEYVEPSGVEYVEPSAWEYVEPSGWDNVTQSLFVEYTEPFVRGAVQFGVCGVAPESQSHAAWSD